MRNRQKQRELRRAGIRKEERIPAVNRNGYYDLTAAKAVEKIVERKANHGGAGNHKKDF